MTENFKAKPLNNILSSPPVAQHADPRKFVFPPIFKSLTIILQKFLESFSFLGYNELDVRKRGRHDERRKPPDLADPAGAFRGGAPGSFPGRRRVASPQPGPMTS